MCYEQGIRIKHNDGPKCEQCSTQGIAFIDKFTIWQDGEDVRECVESWAWLCADHLHQAVTRFLVEPDNCGKDFFPKEVLSGAKQ